MKRRFVAVGILLAVALVPMPVYAGTKCGGTKYHQVTTTIDIGCTGQGNPVTDMLFGILRFLSIGVGIIIVGSLIWAGMQYIYSRDDPGMVSSAKNRILYTVVALIIYIFAAAILNFIIPQGFFG